MQRLMQAVQVVSVDDVKAAEIIEAKHVAFSSSDLVKEGVKRVANKRAIKMIFIFYFFIFFIWIFEIWFDALNT